MASVELKVTKWNADKLLARTRRILEDYAPVIAEEARRQIGLVRYEWDRGTLRFRSIGGLGRKTNTGVYVAAGLRDILDTGELRDSQQAPRVSANQLSIVWAAPYSGIVLRGGNYGSYINPAGRKVEVGTRPGRDWITPAFQAEPPLPFFVKRWKELSGG